MPDTQNPFKRLPEKTRIIFVTLILMVGIVYYFSNPAPQNYYDYTFRVADNILRGSVAITDKPPSWLNEFVPFEGSYFSVFPLGSVVSMAPFAVLKLAGILKDMPAPLIAALQVGGICLFLLLISLRYEISTEKRILMILGMLFGTWMWTNLTMGGAWQLALGFAMLGELGAIYYTVYDRKPWLAGLFFAIGFGNRTEILLTAPIFMFLFLKPALFTPGEPKKQKKKHKKAKQTGAAEDTQPEMQFRFSKEAVVNNWKVIASFCIAPFILGVATLVYNYIRFHSFTDFGYARIPGVLKEPWYNHGIFSLYYIPRQAVEMLWKPWEVFPKFPYLKPNGFSSSILWSSPFLLLLLRSGSADKVLKYASWAAIAILTLLLWIHGNSGGWQFGYRYAMVLLPWIFVILLENGPKKVTPLEWAAYIFSFAANIYATWLFHWSGYLKM
jgi:hypothetical protein